MYTIGLPKSLRVVIYSYSKVTLVTKHVHEPVKQ